MRLSLLILLCGFLAFCECEHILPPKNVYSIVVVNNEKEVINVETIYMNPFKIQTFVDKRKVGPGTSVFFRSKNINDGTVEWSVPIVAVTINKAGMNINNSVRVENFKINGPTYEYVLLVVPDEDNAKLFQVLHFPPNSVSYLNSSNSSCGALTSGIGIHSIILHNYLDRPLQFSVIYTDPNKEFDFMDHQSFIIDPQTNIVINKRSLIDPTTGIRIDLNIKSIVVQHGEDIFVVIPCLATIPTINYPIAINGDTDHKINFACISVTHGLDPSIVQRVCYLHSKMHPRTTHS